MPAADRIEMMPARWEAPRRVRAFTTLRGGGVSGGEFASLNLGTRAGDDPARVAENRRLVREALDIPAEPAWLKQVHGAHCVDAGAAGPEPGADGSHTDSPGRVCAVLTADCLPLFVCDANAGRVGLFHVGWRGLAAGIVEQALAVFAGRAGIHCWLGPAIGPDAFEIGLEVRDALAAPGNEACFKPSMNEDRWMADLYGLVAHRLRRGGVANVAWDAGACTHRDAGRFFSHRRSGRCGRMASLIWIEPDR